MKRLKKAKVWCCINGSPCVFETLATDFTMAWSKAVERGHDEAETIRVVWL